MKSGAKDTGGVTAVTIHILGLADSMDKMWKSREEIESVAKRVSMLIHAQTAARTVHKKW
jgi:hypothetical protein